MAETTTTRTTRTSRSAGTSNLKRFSPLDWPLWKIALGQDFAILGATCFFLLFAPVFGIQLQHAFSTFMGWPKSTQMVQSDTVMTLLGAIGAVGLGFGVPIYRAIVNNDVDFAVSVAWYNLSVGIGLMYLSFIGGPASKMLMPFAFHDFLSAGLIFAGVPDSSPFWGALSMLNLA